MTIQDYISQLSLPEEPANLYEPISYSLEGGGKRLRPQLVVLSWEAFETESRETLRGNGLERNALNVASAIEVFHNFTLLHDDIMDNAATRRGRPSVQARWGVNGAILSGDAMMIYAYSLLEKVTPYLLSRILPVFNATSLRVCEGQQMDMDFADREQVTLAEYEAMIGAKTAALFAGAVVMGAICGGASAEQIRLIDEFGYELGIAFQIQDDLLDCYGNEQELGKRIGGDIVEGKKSFLMVAALERADEKTRYRLLSTLHNKEMIAEQRIATILDVYAQLGIRAIAESAVTQHTDKALAALAALNLPKTEPLRELALELTKRIA